MINMKTFVKILFTGLTMFIIAGNVKAQKPYEVIARVTPPDPDMSGIAVSSAVPTLIESLL